MTSPVTGPTSADEVVAWLQLGGDRVDAAEKVEPTVAAVNAVVRRWLSPDPVTGEWSADHVQGAKMLAGRIYRRRNSALGMATFEGEGAAYVQRTDPDIALLLELGYYTRPAVG